MARSNVPKFGNWDNEDNVPYTVYFDKARKNKGAGGKLINPNDPQENPEIFASMNPPPPAAPAPVARPKQRARPEDPYSRGALRPPVMEHKDSMEESGEFKQFSDSPARESSRGHRPARSAKPSVGSELSFDRSPLHPAAKVMGRGGGGSPHWEARSNNVDSSHGTPGRSRLRPARPDETNDRGAAVPRFGAWNESDPQSAENFTHIFDKVREERKTVPVNAPGTPKYPSYAKPSRPSAKPKKFCFGCW